MVINKQEKWLENDLIARATLLHNMKDNIIPLFEEHGKNKRYDGGFRSKVCDAACVAVSLFNFPFRMRIGFSFFH